MTANDPERLILVLRMGKRMRELQERYYKHDRGVTEDQVKHAERQFDIAVGALHGEVPPRGTAMTTQPQERDIEVRRMQATQVAMVVLELHEKCLTLVGSKEHADEWVKCRQDYVSACSTGAALMAAAFEDALAEITRLRAQPSPREVALEKALRQHCIENDTVFGTPMHHCKVCGVQWVQSEPESHARGCLLAALSPAQKGEKG